MKFTIRGLLISAEGCFGGEAICENPDEAEEENEKADE